MTLRRTLTALVFLPVAVLVLTFAVANRHEVVLSLDPFSKDGPVLSFAAPLFLVLFAVLMLGVLMGGTAAWLNQAKNRRRAREARDAVARLESEMAHLRAQMPSPTQNLASGQHMALTAHPPY